MSCECWCTTPHVTLPVTPQIPSIIYCTTVSLRCDNFKPSKPPAVAGTIGKDNHIIIIFVLLFPNAVANIKSGDFAGDAERQDANLVD
jgi:hypothetical protein